MTSNDRTNWTAVASGTALNLHGVASGFGGVVIIVGDNGKVLRSQDGGKTWNNINVPTTKRLNAVASAGTSFITVGESGTILRSSDGGLSWSIDNSNLAASSSLNGVAYFGSSHIIAVGDAGTIITTNGAPWVRQTTQTSNNLYGVTVSTTDFGRGGKISLAVAVGENGYVTQSSDAITWTQNTNLSTIETLYGISSDSNRIVIVGSSGDIFKSDNKGSSWNNTYSDNGTVINTVTIAGNGQAVAMGNLGLVLNSDSDLTTWLKTNKSEPDLNAMVVSDDGTYVAVGYGVIMASKDGANWTSVANVGRLSMKGVAVHRYSTGTLFVAVGVGGTFMTSKDGYNWSKQQVPFSSSLSSVAINSISGRIVVVGEKGTSYATSDRGQTWVQKETRVEKNLNSIVADSTSDSFIAVGDAGTALVLRGQYGSWDTVNSGITENLYGVSLGLGAKNAVAVGENGVIICSQDKGKTWSNSPSPTITKTLKAVTSTGDDSTFYAVGVDGIAMKIQNFGTILQLEYLPIMNGVPINGVIYH